MIRFKTPLCALALVFAGSTHAAGPSEGVSVNVLNTPLPVTVQAPTTVLLFDQFLSIDSSILSIDPITISTYKTIRIVLRRSACGPCGTTPIQAYIRTVGTATSEARTIDKIPLDGDDLDIGEYASRVYDTVGGALVVSFQGPTGSNSSVRLMVFGRSN